MPLDLALRPKFTREDIIVGRSNRTAVGVIDLWPQWPSPIVVLTGPKGSGKSHVAEAWSAKANARAMQPGNISGWNSADDLSHAYLIEDVGENPLDETALFHLVNSVREHGGSLLLTSRLKPAGWKVTLPDLTSRLQAATVAEIAEPEDALLVAVLAKLFADRQVTVEANVSEYLVTRMERSFSEAVRIVAALDALALEKKSRITRSLAASLFVGGDPRQADLGL